MKKTAKPKNSNRGKPRRRVVPFWRHRHFRIPLVLLLVGLAAGGSWRRVVEYGLSRRSPTREALSITHVFVRGNLPAP